MSGSLTMTNKQIAIMQALIRGNPDGSFLDLDELLTALTYETTKQSLQFSIRALVKHGLIEKKGLELRRGHQRRVLAPTPRTFELMSTGSVL